MIMGLSILVSKTIIVIFKIKYVNSSQKIVTMRAPKTFLYMSIYNFEELYFLN